MHAVVKFALAVMATGAAIVLIAVVQAEQEEHERRRRKAVHAMLSDAMAQAAPYWNASDYDHAAEIYRAAVEKISSHDPRLRELAINVGRGDFIRHPAVKLHMALDTLRCEYGDEHATINEDHFMYYWDDRDGPDWSGWWITPEEVGCTRFDAFSPSDVDTPNDAASIAAWKFWDGVSKIKVLPAQTGGGMLVIGTGPPYGTGPHFRGRTGASAEMVAGYYVPCPEHPHAHKGRTSTATRLVYKRTRPLTEIEKPGVLVD